MKRIVKIKPPPKSFTQWLKNTPMPEAIKTLTIDFKNGRTSAASDLWGRLQNPEKQDLWLQLCKEQGFICAYCSKRLYGDGKVRIEHLEVKSSNIRKTFDYDNLVAVCDSTGNQEGTHCDVKREDKAIFVFPTHIDCESKFYFERNGQIKGVDENVETSIEVLGLNQTNLKFDRENHYKAAEKLIESVLKNSKYQKNKQFETQVNKLIRALFEDYKLCFLDKAPILANAKAYKPFCTVSYFVYKKNCKSAQLFTL